MAARRFCWRGPLIVLVVTGGVLALFATALFLRCPSSEDSVGEEVDPSSLEARLEKARFKGVFIVIDTARNRLYLRKGSEVLREAVCSTGSGTTLIAGDRQWTFRTPTGRFRIRSITRDPLWRKPDWAFLEEGEPVPEGERGRYQSGVLGDYALGIGDGYFIHGTLYTRMLGTNVTHGCIRLGDEDLEFVVRRVRVGTPVYIF